MHCSFLSSTALLTEQVRTNLQHVQHILWLYSQSKISCLIQQQMALQVVQPMFSFTAADIAKLLLSCIHLLGTIIFGRLVMLPSINFSFSFTLHSQDCFFFVWIAWIHFPFSLHFYQWRLHCFSQVHCIIFVSHLYTTLVSIVGDSKAWPKALSVRLIRLPLIQHTDALLKIKLEW